ncbi:morphogenetic protein [Serratia quinivorans]|uniref:Morphogenetic protein n=1 Tax=Serratia quinivorans TaxID=137545 RepID=A0ABV3UF54_9GAMM
MKERPVIFNGEMVRAILDGRKTQTRRPIKFPLLDKNMGCELSGNELAGEVRAGNYSNVPFGQVGDRLWVREAYQGPLFEFDQMGTYLEDTSKFERPEFCEYRADGGKTPEYYDADDNLRFGWKPSIHMPRWASRITLEITGVRVERLQEISETDAIAEGGTEHFNIDWFGPLWASIYGVDSWNANPWVWVIEFKRVGGSDAGK